MNNTSIIAGNMRKVITVLRLTQTRDSYGATKDTYNSTMVLKAELVTAKGTLGMNNMEIFNTNILTFKTWFRDILTTDRIQYLGKLYKIVGTPIELGYREQLQITCELINV
jgi:head-tail adaptor